MKILLTNDDGYQSEGLQALCRALSHDNEVYVVAPDSQRSATSHAIHFHTPVRYTKLEEYCGARAAYITDGTPADCVKFAAMRCGVAFDLAVAGPNNGENYAYDIPYSATVGAAEEAVLCGIAAVALSRTGTSGGYGHCVRFLTENLRKLADFRRPNVFLNVNVPPEEAAVAGVRVVEQGQHVFDDYVERGAEEDVWHIKGNRKDTSLMPPCDAHFADKGYITVTPLTIVRTDYPSLAPLRELLET